MAEEVDTPVADATSNDEDLEGLRKAISQIPDIANGITELKTLFEQNTARIVELEKAKKQDAEEDKKPKDEEDEEEKKPEEEKEKSKKSEKDEEIEALKKSIEELKSKLAEKTTEPGHKENVKKSENITKIVDPIAPPAVADSNATFQGQMVNQLAEAIERSNKLDGNPENLITDLMDDERVSFYEKSLEVAKAMRDAKESVKNLPEVKVDAPAIPVRRGFN